MAPESEPLLPHGALPAATAIRRRPQPRAAFIAVTLVASAAVVGVVLSKRAAGGQSVPAAVSATPDLAAQASSSSSSSSSLKLKFSNEYGQPKSISEGYYAFGSIVEPYKNTTVEVEHADNTSCSEWFFSLEDLSTNESTTYRTRATFVVHQFPRAGAVYEVKATCTAGDDVTVSARTHGKYVRRELRSLTDADARLYLDAMQKVYTTRLEDGVRLYGPKFKGIEWFARWHLGRNVRLSPYHGAPSFFTAHAAFADLFSRSLQSIHPSTAAHYWDFTADAEMMTTGELDTWLDSFMWGKNWFGPYSITADQDYADSNKRVHGRFESVTLGRNFTGNNTHNSYGIRTAPWNNNPATHLDRSTEICGIKTAALSLPGCRELLGTLRDGMDMENFHYTTEYSLHFNFHSLLGGVTECGVDWSEHQDLMELATPTVMEMMSYWKNNYYDGYITCPDNCGLNTTFADCSCSCSVLDDIIAAEESVEESSDDRWYDLFREVVIDAQAKIRAPLHTNTYLDAVSGRYKFINATDDMNGRLYKFLAQTVCRPGKLSPFMSPLGSMYDPVFFPLHVNWERNWSYKRLTQNFNSTWGTGGEWKEKSGWGFDDVLQPFDEVYGKVREPAGTYYTNRELVMLTDPALVSLPHVFDDYGYAPCQ